MEPILCYGKGKAAGYVERIKIPHHSEWIDAWKVFTPYANNIGTELNDDNLNSFVGAPQTVCTETYIMIGMDLNLHEEECENICSYLKTKFARFMLSLAKTSQHATSKAYRFVPMQDFSKCWTDAELYEKYGLTFVESMIKPME